MNMCEHGQSIKQQQQQQRRRRSGRFQQTVVSLVVCVSLVVKIAIM